MNYLEDTAHKNAHAQACVAGDDCSAFGQFDDDYGEEEEDREHATICPSGTVSGIIIF